MKILTHLTLIMLFAFGPAYARDPFQELYGKGWSANIGFGSSRLNNVIGITREFPLDGNWKLHIGGGIGEILIGGGVAWYQKPGREGLFGSFNAGFTGVHANAGYQFDVGTKSFLILGAAIGSGESILGKSAGAMYPIVAYEYHFKEYGSVN